MSNRKTIALLVLAIAVGVISFLISDQIQKYSISEIKESESVRFAVLETGPAIQSARRFSEDTIRSYRLALERAVNPSFKNEFPLWKAHSVTSKVVFSTVADALIYLAPGENNFMYIDLVTVPTQVAFMHGLVNLDHPHLWVDSTAFAADLPSKTVEWYKALSPGIENVGTYTRLLGDGTYRFTNTIKLVKFRDQSIFGIYGPTIKVENDSEEYVRIFGRPAYFEFKLKGPLFLTGEKDFSWVKGEAALLGTKLAETDVGNLFTNSEFFRQSLAEPVLKPKAEDIQKKIKRASEDPAFQYPLWELSRDKEKLREEAVPLKINPAFVDELLMREPALTAGYVLWWFETALGFMWQWTLIGVLLSSALLFIHYCSSEIPASVRAFVGEKGAIIVTGVNSGWILLTKPPLVTWLYMLIPAALWLFDLYLCFLLGREDTETQGRGNSQGS